MMHVILRDGLEDREYLRDFTEGWELLPAQVARAVSARASRAA